MSKYALILAMLLANGSAFAQTLGVLKGHVKGEGGTPVSRAEVSGAGQHVVSDGRGNFTLTGIPVGACELRVSALGYADQTLQLTVAGGIQEVPAIRLETVRTQESLVVVGSLLESHAAALDQQRLAANIKSIASSDSIGGFPDTNAAEATQRIPGVFTARDQGEGRYIQVRGTEARLNKTTLNDVDLPAPEGDLRTVALDVIPLDMLDAIEVSKAITPDMDGDSVGGTVDFKVKKASAKPQFAIGLDYGYNELASDDLTGADLLFSRRFAGDRLGLVTTLSYEDQNRASDTFEATYDDGLPEEFELRDYEVERKRIGAHLGLDYDATEQLSFKLTGSYAQFDDQEYRRRLRNRLGNNRLERELKDRFESQLIDSVQLSSTWFAESGASLKWSLSHAYAHETEPDRYDTTFRQSRVNFAPNQTADAFDADRFQANPLNENLAAYKLDDITKEDNFTNDEHNALKLSYELPVLFGENLATFKFGGKYREKEKTRDQEVFLYSASEDVFLADWTDPRYNGDAILDGRYPIGPMVGSAQAREVLATLADEVEKDYESDSGDYRVKENLTALYAMVTLDLGDNLSILPGLRYESTDGSYTGYQVAYDEGGDFVAVTPQSGNNKDDILLPMVHATYKLAAKTQLRAAATRTYARARVYDQVPYRILVREDREIQEGNPEIVPTEATNLDFMFEHYYGDADMVSFGVFYKDLQDYIYILNQDREFEGDTYQVTSPRNGESAKLWGLEAVVQHHFANGLGFYFNYTYTDSDASLTDRDITLPGQTEKIGNIAISYEVGGFSARVSGNLHGAYITEVGDDASEDIWQDRHFQVDLNASYRFKGYKAFLEVLNLNDEKFRLYEGSELYPIQSEQYKTWGRLGLKLEF